VKMSIFTRLSLTFLSVLLPFYGLTMLLNKQGSDSIRSEITRSVSSRDQFYMQNLEQEIKRLSQIFYELLVDNDPMLIGVSHDFSDPDLLDKVKVLQKRLQMVKASSLFVEKPMIYFPSMDRVITPNGLTDEDKLQNPDEIDKLSRSVDPNRIVQLQDGRFYLSLRYPMSTSLDRPPLFVVMFELSAAQLKNSLQNIVNPQQGDFLLVHTEEHWALSSSRDEQTVQSLKSLAAGKTNRSGAGSVKLGNTTYWESYVASDTLQLSLFVFIPDEKVLGELKSYEKWVWVILAVSIAVILLLALALYRLIHNPMRRLVSAFRIVQQGRFVPIAETEAKDEFRYLFEGFNRMVSQLNVLIHEVYEKEISTQRSELKRLQAQINPHFLYNCFFIMGGLISDKEYGKAFGFVNYLRDYYRFITKNAEDLIPLQEEMRHARTYVDIQTVCYGDRIDVEMEPLPEFLNAIPVPRLIVQPIIENAYKYALVRHSERGELWLHHKVENGCLTILVEDNGQSLDDAANAALSEQLDTTEIKGEEPTGLINVHRRLRLMYGSDSGLTLCRSQLGGLCVMISIKLKNIS